MLVVVAVEVNDKVPVVALACVSLFTNPDTVPLNAGFVAPYVRLAVLEVKVKVAAVTVNAVALAEA